MEPAMGYSLRGCSSSRIEDGLAAAVDFANNGETPAVFDGNADIGVLGDGLVRNTPERAGLCLCHPAKSLMKA